MFATYHTQCLPNGDTHTLTSHDTRWHTATHAGSRFPEPALPGRRASDTHTVAAPNHTHVPGGAVLPPRSPAVRGAALLCSALSAAPRNRSGPAGMSSRRLRPPRSNALQMPRGPSRERGGRPSGSPCRAQLLPAVQAPAGRGGAASGRGGA